MFVRAPPATPHGSSGVVLPGARHGCHCVHGRPPTDCWSSCAFIVVSSGSMIVGFLLLEWSFGQPSP